MPIAQDPYRCYQEPFTLLPINLILRNQGNPDSTFLFEDLFLIKDPHGFFCQALQYYLLPHTLPCSIKNHRRVLQVESKAHPL